MKKFFYMAAALILIISMAGCSGANDAPPSAIGKHSTRQGGTAATAANDSAVSTSVDAVVESVSNEAEVVASQGTIRVSVRAVAYRCLSAALCAEQFK